MVITSYAKGFQRAYILHTTGWKQLGALAIHPMLDLERKRYHEGFNCYLRIALPIR